MPDGSGVAREAGAHSRHYSWLWPDACLSWAGPLGPGEPGRGGGSLERGPSDLLAAMSRGHGMGASLNQMSPGLGTRRRSLTRKWVEKSALVLTGCTISAAWE